MTFVSVLSSLLYLMVSAILLVQTAQARRRVQEANMTTLPLVSDARWARAYALFAAFLGIWMLVWPYTGGLLASIGGAAATYACGRISLSRRSLAPNVASRWEALWAKVPHHLQPSTWIILAAAALTTIALEIPWNTVFPLVWPHAVLIELVLIFLFLHALFALSLGHGIAAAIGAGIITSIGIIQAFVIDFKGAVLSIGDLFAFSTAISVGGGYAYQLDSRMLVGMAFGELAVLLCSLIYDEPGAPAIQRSAVLGWLGRGGIVLALLAGAVLLPDYQTQLAIKVDYWWEWQLLNHEHYCFFPSFIAEAQDLPIDQPKGYSTAAAANAERDLVALFEQSSATSTQARAAQAQWDQLQPSVVVIMNETFFDLSDLGDFGGYKGPTFFRTGFSDALEQGKLAVSVNGGGTCNTEFEFLTGESMAFIGNGKYPYTLYEFDSIPSLPRQFADLGYDTTAIHPNLASNWDRDRVYTSMGFAKFDDITAFEGASQYHNAISDEATYDHVLDILTSSTRPQFIFDVTMQNHSGYDQGGIPETTLKRYARYRSDAVDDETNALITEYLACIRESDRALREFVAELRTLDRPVILVFFGDHQPYFTNVLNNALFHDESTVTHDERLYLSDYVIWANYDVAGNDQSCTQSVASASDLAARVLSEVGAPLTTYQKAQLGATTLLSQLNLFGYRDLDGMWHELDDTSDTEGASAVRKLAFLSYRDFASRL